MADSTRDVRVAWHPQRREPFMAGKQTKPQKNMEVK